MTGTGLDGTPREGAPGPVLLDLHHVARAFGHERAVRQVDLQVRAGEIHALVGLNGAGGIDVGSAPSSVWARVGHMIETPFAYAELTVTETIRAAARLRGMASAAADIATSAVIADLALEHWSARRSGTLSLGNRQRLGLACAIVHAPTLLVLDEPTNALDPAGVVRVRQHLLDRAARGTGILVSSHHLDEVARMAARITVLHSGVVIGGLPPDGRDLERQFFDMVYDAELAATSVSPLAKEVH